MSKPNGHGSQINLWQKETANTNMIYECDWFQSYVKLISGCDWEGYLTRDDFLEVAYVSMQKQANRYDDIKAAFR